MKFFENFDLLLTVFIFIPLAIAAGFSYVLTIRNYGAVVYNPPWKKTINAITNEIFFLFVFGINIMMQIDNKNWIELSLTILFLIMCFGIILLSRFLPKLHEYIKNKTKTNEEKSKGNKSSGNNKNNNPNRNIPMSGYISVALSYFSRLVFAIFIIIDIILVSIINTQNINPATVNIIIDYWNIIANIATSIAISINGHLIFELLSEQRIIPNDSKINKLKERLND